MPKQLWVERYRPRQLSDVIFPDAKSRQTFAGFIAAGDIPHLLLHGSPGTGKSSLSSVLLKELRVNESDVLRIPCSDEKIDAMRDKVRVFASTMPYGRFKVVQLEEVDYLGHDAMALLRSLIEDNQDSCRFIATCNYVNKVIPPLRSRFTEFQFNRPDEEDVLQRAADILDREGVDFAVDDLQQVVTAGYPDMRKIVLLLEQCSQGGRLAVTEAQQASDWKLGLLPLLKAGQLEQARKLVCEQASKEDVGEVFRFLYDHLAVSGLPKNRHGQAIVLLAQYQYQAAFVADHEINLAAAMVELGELYGA